MKKKQFAVAASDSKYKTFVIYVTLFTCCVNIHLSCKLQIADFIIKEAFTKVFINYSDFANVFSPDLASELPKHTWINNHAIELVKGQHPFYEPIYNLKPVELETLKTYIEINLINDFLRPSKLPIDTSIFFNQKLDRLFQLCINY